ILKIAHEISERERWKLELAGFDETHTHLVLSWTDYVRWEDADRRLKNLLSLKLNRLHSTPGKRWFVRGRSAPRRVKDRKHFNSLQHRAILVERAELRRKLVKIRAEMVRLQIPRDDVDHFFQPQDVLRKRVLLRSSQLNCSPLAPCPLPPGFPEDRPDSRISVL